MKCGSQAQGLDETCALMDLQRPRADPQSWPGSPEKVAVRIRGSPAETPDGLSLT